MKEKVDPWIGWTAEEIPITYWDAGEKIFYSKNISVMRKDCFAIHEVLYEGGDTGWRITHIPSQYHAFDFYTALDAIDCVTLLEKYTDLFDKVVVHEDRITVENLAPLRAAVQTDEKILHMIAVSGIYVETAHPKANMLS